jgi:NADH-quinone oxidoreductase subunit A
LSDLSAPATLFTVFFAIALLFPMALLGVARLMGPKKPSGVKGAAYECGETPVGRPWIRYRAAYYVFALVFVVFDIEAAYLYAWASVFKQLGMFGLVEMGLFVGVLVVGLAYVWRKGILRWV